MVCPNQILGWLDYDVNYAVSNLEWLRRRVARDAFRCVLIKMGLGRVSALWASIKCLPNESEWVRVIREAGWSYLVGRR